MNKKIAIIGAYDRFNYGDLLFPIIIEKVLDLYKIKYPIEYYGLIESDLSKYGGKPTYSIKKLFEEKNMPDGSFLIIAGGEILGATWSMMHMNLSPKITKYIFGIMDKIMGKKKLDNISRDMFGSNLELPWVISPSDFNSQVKVIYNTVGGARITSLENVYQQSIIEKMSQASYVSVRDTKTKDILNSFNLQNIEIAPDSAILMSEFFTLSELESLINLETRKIIDMFPKGYICFQSNLHLAKNNEHIIAKELQKIYEDYGYGVVLLPIGRATGHEDQVILKKIKKIINIPSIVPKENSIYDIMTLIAKSKLYMGTSLHGCITSLSFCIPHIGLTTKQPKLSSFLATWDIPEQSICIPYDKISKQANYILKVPEKKLKNKRDELVSRSYKNFKNMMEKTNTLDFQ